MPRPSEPWLITDLTLIDKNSIFSVDGMLLDALKVGEVFTITDRDVTLSGLLADGSPFSFDLNTTGISGDSFSQGTTLTVTLVVPEPASFAMLMLGGCLLLWQRRSAPSLENDIHKELRSNRMRSKHQASILARRSVALDAKNTWE